ncbi:MAG: acyl transferase, partial [Bacteroidia bacterium]
MKPSIDSIFNIKTPAEFREAGLAVFNYQAKENEVYSRYLSGLGIVPPNVSEIEQIPFLPIEFFKSHLVIT